MNENVPRNATRSGKLQQPLQSRKGVFRNAVLARMIDVKIKPITTLYIKATENNVALFSLPTSSESVKNSCCK
jgi:hypothetical protein